MIQLLKSGLTTPQESIEISYRTQKSAQQALQKNKVNLENLFQEKKQQCNYFLFSLFSYHLTSIIITAVLQKVTSRLVTIFQISFISTEAFFVCLCFMLILILLRREFKTLKNNNIICIQDLSSYLNLLKIILQYFQMFKIMYQFMNILQLATIGIGIYINISQTVDIFVLIISILIGIRIIILILIFQYTNNRQTKVNVALNYSSYKIINAPQCDQCVICLQNFSIGQQVNQLPCNQKHVFHKNCISEWLNKLNNCPICREIPNYF